MPARITHKRGATLRWDCQRTTDPRPGSGMDPEPISLTDVTVRCALRNDVIGFYQPLTIKFAGPSARAAGRFTVYYPGQSQENWPLGDVYFDFSFSNATSGAAGEVDDIDITKTAIMHIQKEEVDQWL